MTRFGKVHRRQQGLGLLSVLNATLIWSLTVLINWIVDNDHTFGAKATAGSINFANIPDVAAARRCSNQLRTRSKTSLLHIETVQQDWWLFRQRRRVRNNWTRLYFRAKSSQDPIYSMFFLFFKNLFTVYIQPFGYDRPSQLPPVEPKHWPQSATLLRQHRKPAGVTTVFQLAAIAFATLMIKAGW